MMNNFYAGVALAVVLFAVGFALTDAQVKHVDSAIKLATAAIGLIVASTGAVKGVFGLTRIYAGTSADVTPAGITTAVGALLVLASAIP
jgi:hypothetical protein